MFGTRATTYKLTIIEFRWEIRRRFLTIRGSGIVGGMDMRDVTSFKMDLDHLINGNI